MFLKYQYDTYIAQSADQARNGPKYIRKSARQQAEVPVRRRGLPNNKLVNKGAGQIAIVVHLIIRYFAWSTICTRQNYYTNHTING